MTRPLHRSRGFWFGLAGLLSILGMWLHSARWTMDGEFARADQSDGVWLSHSCGLAGVYAGWVEVPAVSPWRMGGGFRRNDENEEGDSLFRGPRWRWTYTPPTFEEDPFAADPFASMPSPGYYFGSLMLPHWLLVVLYLPAWYGAHRWMRWRARHGLAKELTGKIIAE